MLLRIYIMPIQLSKLTQLPVMICFPFINGDEWFEQIESQLIPKSWQQSSESKHSSSNCLLRLNRDLISSSTGKGYVLSRCVVIVKFVGMLARTRIPASWTTKILNFLKCAILLLVQMFLH